MEAKSNLPSPKTIESVLIRGDLAELTEEQRLSYYRQVCESVGLNTLTKPFDYLKLNNKLVLYAKRDATDQLRKLHNVSVKVVAREKIEDCYVVTAQASMPSGRVDESTGAVSVGHLKGDALANAYMKAETKAKRRVTLSICGLGLLDETEVESISDDQKKIEIAVPADPGDFVLNFTKGYKGRKIKDIPEEALRDLLTWCKTKQTFIDFQMAASIYLEQLPQDVSQTFFEPLPPEEQITQ